MAKEPPNKTNDAKPAPKVSPTHRNAAPAASAKKNQIRLACGLWNSPLLESIFCNICFRLFEYKLRKSTKNSKNTPQMYAL